MSLYEDELTEAREQISHLQSVVSKMGSLLKLPGDKLKLMCAPTNGRSEEGRMRAEETEEAAGGLAAGVSQRGAQEAGGVKEVRL